MAPKEAEDRLTLMDLPDCVILTLLSYLDATALYNLSRTNEYFKTMVEDSKLWRYIDARAEPNTSGKVAYCLDRLHDRTNTLMMKANNNKLESVPYKLFPVLCGYENITVLALENQVFNAKKITMNDFPESLEELSLKNTFIKCSKYFFRNSKDRMKNLRVLILDGCAWLESSFIMSVTKYKSLEIISTVMCKRVETNAITYFSISQVGCRRLKIFDCRFTMLGHTLLAVFHRLPSLLGFYFHNIKTLSYDYGIENKNDNSGFSGYAESKTSRIFDTENINDLSLINYMTCIGAENVVNWPKSVLYKNPYDECKCGYRDNAENMGVRNDDFVGNEDEIFSTNLPESSIPFVCDRHRPKLKEDYSCFDNQTGSSSTTRDTEEGGSHDDSTSSHNDSSSDEECCEYSLRRGNNIIIYASARNFGDVVQNNNPVVVIDSLRREMHRDFMGRELRQSLERNEEASSSNAAPSNTYSSENAEENNQHYSNEQSSSLDQIQPQDQQPRPVSPFNEPGPSRGFRINIRSSQAGTNFNVENLNNQNYDSSSDENDDNASVSARVGQKRTFPPDEGEEESRAKRIRIYRSPLDTNSTPPRNNTRIRIWRIPTINDNQRMSYCIGQASGELYAIRLCRNLPNEGRQIAQRDLKQVPLRQLSLRGFSKVTDHSLKYLEKLNLDLLDLTYTGVTREGIEHFLIENPNCRIIHPNYCICKPIFLP